MNRTLILATIVPATITLGSCATSSADQPRNEHNNIGGAHDKAEARPSEPAKTEPLYDLIEVVLKDPSHVDIDKDKIKMALLAKQPPILECYTTQHDADPRFKVNMMLRFTVAPDGTVSFAEIRGGHTSNLIFNNCVLHRVAAMKFTMPDPVGEFTVSFPLERHGKIKNSVSLSRAEIEGVLKRAKNRIKHCYDKLVSKEPELKGKVVPQWVIMGNGKVGSITAAQNTTGSTELGECVVRVIKGLRFQKPRWGTNVLITYPYTFSL